MRLFPRPKIVISRCIEFDHCGYDGSLIPSDFVKALKPHVDFSPVCAEMEIGLGVPRDSIRIVAVQWRTEASPAGHRPGYDRKDEEFLGSFFEFLVWCRWIYSQVPFAFLRYEGYKSLFKLKQRWYPRYQVLRRSCCQILSGSCY
jgi:hypothetical protein